jgi:hypothetical protein
VGTLDDQALLWSHKGVGVGKLSLLDPLRADIHSQPLRTWELREVTLRGFVAKVVLDRNLGGHLSTFEKKSDENLRTRAVPASLRTVAAEA